MNEQSDGWGERWMGREMDEQSDGWTVRWMDRHTGGQTEKWMGRDGLIVSWISHSNIKKCYYI